MDEKLSAIAARHTFTDPVAFVTAYYPGDPPSGIDRPLTKIQAYQLLQLVAEIAASEDEDVAKAYSAELQQAQATTRNLSDLDWPQLIEQYGDALEFLGDTGKTFLLWYLYKKKNEGKISKSKTPGWCALYKTITGDECDD
ncbi:hypothetical protein QWY85_13050 [Neolewinella lacunae]|uniref:Uncharacterized protein n=1 Tax=Neolewinella lacunae TaxID=1517758 RepID=A0A923PMQ7_9BACT|nr:hypothetical protein [Neolewinella lacunae]MBC6995556.1 hypothetical protein [Neolewinella lacunae]MDN3635592.1 hypothetical protein [Neolewinella lacunae]